MLIFSKYKKKQIIGAFIKLKNFKKNRIDICPENEFLQISLINLANKNFLKPHKHLKLNRNTSITQEAWIVLKGSIQTTIYDLNNKVLKKFIISNGDMFVLFRGGHSFKALKKNTIMYEIKNGPYYGKKKDHKII